MGHCGGGWQNYYCPLQLHSWSWRVLHTCGISPLCNREWSSYQGFNDSNTEKGILGDAHWCKGGAVCPSRGYNFLWKETKCFNDGIIAVQHMYLPHNVCFSRTLHLTCINYSQPISM